MIKNRHTSLKKNKKWCKAWLNRRQQEVWLSVKLKMVKRELKYICYMFFNTFYGRWNFHVFKVFIVFIWISIILSRILTFSMCMKVLEKLYTIFFLTCVDPKNLNTVSKVMVPFKNSKLLQFLSSKQLLFKKPKSYSKSRYNLYSNRTSYISLCQLCDKILQIVLFFNSLQIENVHYLFNCC